MFTDEAWDMPKVNWMPQGSFEPGEIPPTEDPDSGDMVQLPCVNRHWLPFIQGCLDQLRNPSTWIVADDDAMNAVLYKVARLKQMFGEWSTCVSFDIRFDPGSCQLQKTLDGGATWAEVDGWSSWLFCVPPQTLLEFDSGCTLSESLDGGETYSPVPGWIENFSECVQEYVPIVGLPPNPGGQDHDAFACSIASYLANEVILNAMQAGVTAITDDLSLLSFGANLLTLIPEFILVKLGYDAVEIIYTAIAEGTLSDYEDAVSDGTLWNEVTCAIYSAIVSAGYVTPGNFSAIVSNVSGISYTHADVITAIVDYLNSLGAVGLAQLSQRAGLLVGASCDCASGPWCTWWQPGELNMCDGDWTPTGSTTCSSEEFHSYAVDGGGQCLGIQAVLPSVRTVTAVRCDMTTGGGDAGFSTYFFDSSGTVIRVVSSSNWNAGSEPPAVSGVKMIQIVACSGDSAFSVGSLKVGGPDSGSPWLVNNGVCD